MEMEMDVKETMTSITTTTVAARSTATRMQKQSRGKITTVTTTNNNKKMMMKTNMKKHVDDDDLSTTSYSSSSYSSSYYYVMLLLLLLSCCLYSCWLAADATNNNAVIVVDAFQFQFQFQCHRRQNLNHHHHHHYANIYHDPRRRWRSASSSSSPPRSFSSSTLLLLPPLSSSSSSVSSDTATTTTTTTTTTSLMRENKVTFIAPLLDYGYPPAVQDLEEQNQDQDQDQKLDDQDQQQQKPILLYLPGFDGTFLCPFLQFPELNTEFEVWCMATTMEDRSTYQELKYIVLDFIDQKMNEQRNDQDEDQDGNDAAGDAAGDALADGDKTVGNDKEKTTKSATESKDFSTEPEMKEKETTTKKKKSKPGNGIFANWFPSSSSSSSSSPLFQNDSGNDNGNDKDSTSSRKKGRPIYIAGESFGGILASDVALTILEQNEEISKQRRSGSSKKKTPKPEASTFFASSTPPGSSSFATTKKKQVNLQGLILINPATCYDRSQLAMKGPKVAKLSNKLLYVPALFSQLIPLFTDEYSVPSLGLILSAKALPSVIDNPQRESYMGRVAFSLPTKLEFMPPTTLNWRLEEWLSVGCENMMARNGKQMSSPSSKSSSKSFDSYPSFRTLIVVGENDKTLPSIAEAERLASKVMLPKQTQIHVVEGAGHASTCGSRVDLTAVIRNRFTELTTATGTNKNKGGKKISNNKITSTTTTKRTSMKPEAQIGSGPYFGMEERYDKAPIGLNPILYWSKDNWRRVDHRSLAETKILIPGTLLSCSYSTAKYSMKKPRRKNNNNKKNNNSKNNSDTVGAGGIDE